MSLCCEVALVTRSAPGNGDRYQRRVARFQSQGQSERGRYGGIRIRVQLTGI
jgi:hypothetical protein